MKLIIALLTVVATCLGTAIPARAKAPGVISIQGRLTDTAGTPLVGTHSVRFTIYYDSVFSGFMFQETKSITTDSLGLFSTLLGSESPLEPVFDTVTFLGIKVGTDPELTPRIRLASSMWAHLVRSIDGATGGAVEGDVSIFGNVGFFGRLGVIEWQGGVAIGSYSIEPTSEQNYAMLGRADNSTNINIAVYGEAHDANGSSNSAGIYGRSIGDFGGIIWAGYFDGWTNVAGNFYASAKFFRIDDPTNPTQSTFEHACVESDEYKNVYDGVATLDAEGRCEVALPDWFEALNKDFRYQLTALGAPGPNLHIAQEISGGQFRIAGGPPHRSVSWMVTGVRKDPYALAHPIEVQKAKPEGMRGKYLHPVEYGVSETLGVDYATRKFMDEQASTAAQARPKPPTSGSSK